MLLETTHARERFVATRVARLATVSGDGQPHLVPVTFAVAPDEGTDVIVIAIDHKPKTSTNLKRLRNIATNPRVSLLADHYEDDWTHLWWARADGTARVLDHDPEAVSWLCAKYPQYAETPPEGPVIRISVTSWSGWAYTG